MNLYLMGYRGSGKSTVAPLIADALRREVVDTDRMIESRAGKTIAEIFSQHGEPEFRRLETQSILSIEASQNRVVALGGGAPLAQSNRGWMADNGKTVWLTASAETLWSRIAGDSGSTETRPDLTDQGGMAEVVDVLETRRPVYRDCADYTIDVTPLSPEQIADRIVSWWKTTDKP